MYTGDPVMLADVTPEEHIRYSMTETSDMGIMDEM